MKILFVGGTGIISSACSELAIKQGAELYVLNRGESTNLRPIAEEAKWLKADFNDIHSVKEAIDPHDFDVVVNWIIFTASQIDRDIQLFRNKTSQYVFISSASAYKTPPSILPVTESTILDNPYWEYSRNKIACEERLINSFQEEKFPCTIVRPSHTYDKTLLPFKGGYTIVDRMRRGKPVIVHGDGTSLWTLTHHEDFATGFIGLLGNSHAIGEIFHITSDEWLTWNQIFHLVAEAAGVSDPELTHIPSELITAYDLNWGAGLLGDKSNCMIFDNSKIKRVVPDFVAKIPFSQGAKEIIDWYDQDPTRKIIDEEYNLLIERILSAYNSAWPG
jgi:nucleoside-diphosphate-sugar epimerase